MSYDIRWCVETVKENCEGDHFAVVHTPEYDSPTYNYRNMFVACMDWDYHQGETDDGGNWHHVYYPMEDVLPKLRHGLAQLIEYPEKYRKYEPENGWGTLDGAIKCIGSWIAELTDEDDWDCVCRYWPLDALWWRW